MIKGSDPLFGSDDHCIVVIFTTCYVWCYRNYLMIHYVDVTSSYNLKQSYVIYCNIGSNGLYVL